jgi:peptidoglycan hydrolase-like protein with peptidoglycan-binding domain
VATNVVIPSGRQPVGSDSIDCPLKHPATVMVEVLEGETATLIPDFDVTLNGPSAGVRVPSGTFTALFNTITPGRNFSVTALPGTNARHKGVRTVRKLPLVSATFDLAYDDNVRVQFRVYRKLETVSVDHHFVPGVENLEIKYNIEGLEGVKVTLQVVNDNHVPPLIFERDLTTAEKVNGDDKTITWDGKTNCTAGPLQGKLINPLIGPCKIRLSAADFGTVTADIPATATRVLYHSISLTHGSWVEDSRTPPARVNPTPVLNGPTWAAHIKWVQFRLNRLGYFAGVVNGVYNAQTKRAIKRYTYEMIGGTESDDAAEPLFVTSLSRNTLQTPLFSNGDVIEDETVNSKIYIQNNYFYHTEGAGGTTDWNKNDGHWFKESDFADVKGGKLDRFEAPIEAVITLESRLQVAYNADDPGINSPGALGAAPVKWTIVDPPEDVSILPAFVDVTSPSGSSFYMKAVRAKVIAVPDPTGLGNDNCPAAAGGPAAGFVETLLPQFPVTAGATAFQATTAVYQDDTTHPLLDGRTAILFRGSHIAGDNYIVKAGIDFTGMTNKLALETDHTTFQAAGSYADVLNDKTGTMTVWRRRRASAVVNWTEMVLPAVDWTDIVSAFAEAFTEFDISTVVTDRVDTFITSPGEAAGYLDLVAAEMNRVGDRGTMVFTYKHMYPFPLVKGPKEAQATFRLRVSGAASEFNNHMVRITLGTDTRQSVGEWLAGQLRLSRRPGVIILRALPFAGIDMVRTTGCFRKTTVVTEAQFGRTVGSNCTGVGGGVTYISEGYRAILKDGFLLTHEIAHCYYLSHPFQRPVDHDMGDRNCTMWYLHSDNKPYGRPKLNMSTGSPNLSRFCGKCLLKLRGWKVADATYTHTPAYAYPAVPVTPVMTFEEYKVCDGSYYAANATDPTKPDEVLLSLGATDPKDTNGVKRVLGPLKFLHVHKLTWASSDGQLSSLKGVRTRERIVFNQPTQASPFCAAADPDQNFAQVGNDADKGDSTDEHSVMLPSLICEWPLVAGSLVGHQYYEYSVDGKEWVVMDNAEFRLTKEVYQNTVTNEWILSFEKANWPVTNPTPFLFEMQYKIGDQPFRPVLIGNNKNKTATALVPVRVVVSEIYASGPTKAVSYSTKSGVVKSLPQIKVMGLAASDPWE